MQRPVARVATRPVFRLFAIVCALTLLTGQVAASPRSSPSADDADAQRAPDARADIESGLLKKLEVGETDRFVVEFAAEADLSEADDIESFRGRGQFVVDALKGAARAQREAIGLVRRTQGARAESFWLRNTLIVSGDAALAERLAALPGVERVRAERVYPLIKPVETQIAVLAEGSEPEWGVSKIGADAVWEAGITGSGVVVANIDTGVDFEHPALVNQYRGNLGGGEFDHNYSWWDPTGICGDTPCDNAEHGTHTMGTMVGGDGPGPFTPDVGVAPGARWIAAKGCEDFGCSEGALLSSGQFILAPTDLNGDNEDVSKRADIVNNSWGGGPGDEFYLDVVQAWRAAGIVPVFSAGNSGPFCDSGGSPGDFLESFSVGATDIDDVIADFSSRGPSVFGKGNPDVSAPGVDVVSTVPGGGYASFSGTSMAAPHVTGTLALVLSAEIGLAGQFDAATAALRDTALDILDDQCGGDEDGDPNNVYGDGRIDAAAAVALVATGGTLAGTVTDSDSGDPIGGATVSAHSGTRTFNTTSAADGTFDLFLAAGTYAVTATAFGYAMGMAEAVEIVTDETTTQDFALVALPRHTVSGIVSAASDGAPIEDASVTAVGTPVAPALTDSNGAYELVLPEGSYELRASAGGCTDFDFEDIELFEDIEVNFAVARKLDNFGHGCSTIDFDWVDASTQTALYGDEFAGRLRLPFEFPFYGESYGEVFISDNGYVNFLGPDQFNGFPVEIPSAGPPNAAIYALWQEMQISGDGAIEYDTIGDEPNRAFVIEYADVSDATFEVKLWENGEIDFLYADAGDGGNAGIGIENAEGDDALQYSYLTDILGPETAFRISEVPTGFVTGTVTDLNDGLPIAGATVEALGSGRSTTTDSDGIYRLRLLPGSYELSISAPGYQTHEESISLAVDDELVVDAALAAPIGSIDPTELNESVELGDSTEATVTLSNSGTAPLSFTVRERPTGEEAPELPGIEGSPTRAPEWRVRAAPGSLPVADTSAIPSDLLGVIIEDPEGDASGVDVTTVRAGADEAELTMEIDLAAGSSVDDMAGYVFLDVDQDPSTGLPAEAIAGLPTQDVGMEYFVDLFAIHDPEPVVLLIDVFTFEIVAVMPARLDGQTLGFDVPLEAIGGDDGFVNTAMVIGDFFQPTDWAPDEGHGTIEPFTDAPWMSESPETGSIDPGDSAEITVTLGGPEVAAGTYTGKLVFLTSDPKRATFTVDVTLTVALPESFGAISGTITDAHDGDPLPATVTVTAETAAEKYVATAEAGADGTFTLFGPEGAWPGQVTLDGYVPQDIEVTVTRGVNTPGVDVALHAEQPHATVEGGPFTFVLTEGQTGDGTLTIGNPVGHAELTFEVGEVNMDAGPTIAPAAAPSALPDGADPLARSTRDLGLARGPNTRGVHVPGDVLAAWPTTGADLPWGVGFDGDVWLSDAFESGDLCGFVGACTTHQYSTGGEAGAVLDSSWAEAFVGDMAFDAANGWLWQVHVGGGNELFAIDPSDGSIQATLTGSPWSDISQRGVAHDPATDTFYVGGWNEGVVYQVAGTSHATPGETLGSCTPADPAISGLAWNPAFSLLWMATNSETDTIYLIDPVTCETLRSLDHPEPGFNGAGLEMDTLGNLWTVSQNSATAYLVESGLPNFSDAPWLTVDPLEGSVPIDGSAELSVQVDATGLEPGVYRAQVVVLTNDPDNGAVAVPVTLVVPAYRQGVNAAGTAHTTGDGTIYDADRAYAAGAHGYDGRSTGRRTRDQIAGTEEDALYRTMRQGMAAYRFDVPVEGSYMVDLHFAEIAATRAGARIFTVTIEGQPVLVNLDVFAEAGADAAYDRSFMVEVTDGRLDVAFTAQRGDQPFVSALLVTHRPDLGPIE